MDGISYTDTVFPTLRSHNATSDYEPSMQRSTSSSSTGRPTPMIPPLNLGHSVMSPSLIGPPSPSCTDITIPPAKQTILQRHLAHLARHGINGVASGPENAASDSSMESPRASLVHVGNSVSTPQISGTSGAASTMGSIGSFSSLKGRLSRFGSLNFARRSTARS